jgi:hypothetical protein
MTKSVFFRDGRLFLPGFFFSRGQKKRVFASSSSRPDLSSRHSQDAGLERYAIAGQEADWSEALVGGKGPKSGLLSVKRKARGDAEETPAKEKKDRKEKKAASAGKKSGSGGKKKR